MGKGLKKEVKNKGNRPKMLGLPHVAIKPGRSHSVAMQAGLRRCLEEFPKRWGPAPGGTLTIHHRWTSGGSSMFSLVHTGETRPS